jgi:ubiquitin-protein ligase
MANKPLGMAVVSAATKALQQELKSLQKEPLEGFTVKLINDNLFEWEVAIFGTVFWLLLKL